jgi:hypothetical protein
MKWSALSSTLTLPVLGYIVQRIDPVDDEWKDVLDVSTDPDVLSYIHYGLTTG